MAVDGIVNYGIGDWCAPFDGPAISVNMSTFKAPVALTDTACYYRSARMLSKMSRVLGLDDPYLARSEEIRAALLRNFVDADTGEVAGACQTSDGCVAFHHLLKPQEEARLMERLAERIAQNGWHIDYGILGSKYVLNMLGVYGR
jgi:alpha-L-rhamnosidase